MSSFLVPAICLPRPTSPTLLRFSLIPAVTLGGLIGGALITNAVTRLSRPRERTSLFLRRRARRKCPRCGGFGIMRCTLCSGEAVCVSILILAQDILSSIDMSVMGDLI